MSKIKLHTGQTWTNAAGETLTIIDIYLYDTWGKGVFDAFVTYTTSFHDAGQKETTSPQTLAQWFKDEQFTLVTEQATV